MIPTPDFLNRLAATLWPAEAEAMERLTGKSRSRQRRKLRDRALLQFLAHHNHCCGDCAFFDRGVCQQSSDFLGVVRTTPGNLCSHWKAK